MARPDLLWQGGLYGWPWGFSLPHKAHRPGCSKAPVEPASSVLRLREHLWALLGLELPFGVGLGFPMPQGPLVPRQPPPTRASLCRQVGQQELHAAMQCLWSPPSSRQRHRRPLLHRRQSSRGLEDIVAKVGSRAVTVAKPLPGCA